MIRLIVKCLERIDKGQCDPLPCLFPLYHFFKCHPPENLHEKLPSIKELEYTFRTLKTFSDQLLVIDLKSSKSFLEFIHNCNPRGSVFVQYVSNFLEKVLENIN